MKKFIRELIKLFVGAISSLAILVGGFLAIAGPLSGLGSDNTWVRIGMCLGGIALVLLGGAGLEISNKSRGGLRGALNSIIDSILRSI